MSSDVLDLKLRSLINACKISGNYKKLSVVYFILTSNKIDEISIKLGIRPRNRKDQENLFEYLNLINTIFEKNLKISIFQPEFIDSLREVELLFLKGRGDIPYDYIKQLITIYYELRKIEIPNLYKGISGETFLQDQGLGTLNFYSRGIKSRKRNDNKFTPVLQYTLSQKEKLIQSKLNKKLTQSDLEMAIQLRKIRKGIENKGKQKIILQGSLKDNIIYEQSQSKLIGYLILGFILISVLFSLVIISEVILFPATMKSLNNILLISVGIGVLFIFIYRSYLKRGKIS